MEDRGPSLDVALCLGSPKHVSPQGPIPGADGQPVTGSAGVAPGLWVLSVGEAWMLSSRVSQGAVGAQRPGSLSLPSPPQT